MRHVFHTGKIHTWVGSKNGVNAYAHNHSACSQQSVHDRRLVWSPQVQVCQHLEDHLDQLRDCILRVLLARACQPLGARSVLDGQLEFMQDDISLTVFAGFAIFYPG